MKTGRDAPGAQRMKQNGNRIGRFVGMKFVEEMMAQVIRIDQFCELATQYFDLFVIEDADAGEIAASVKKFYLLAAETILLPLFGARWPFE